MHDVACTYGQLSYPPPAAAHVFKAGGRRDDVTSVLRCLHWLPVKFRTDFKVLLLAFKAINGLAPFYFTELLHAHAPARTLGS